jgi:hypothetical protein
MVCPAVCIVFPVDSDLKLRDPVKLKVISRDRIKEPYIFKEAPLKLENIGLLVTSVQLRLLLKII